VGVWEKLENPSIHPSTFLINQIFFFNSRHATLYIPCHLPLRSRVCPGGYNRRLFHLFLEFSDAFIFIFTSTNTRTNTSTRSRDNSGSSRDRNLASAPTPPPKHPHKQTSQKASPHAVEVHHHPLLPPLLILLSIPPPSQ